MKKKLILPTLLLCCLFFVAFSPADIEATYSEMSQISEGREFNEEVGSFTEMYTRSVLSDKSTWSHRHKEFTLTNDDAEVASMELALNRN